MKKNIVVIFYLGTGGNFIMNILAHYQKTKEYINFNIDNLTGHSHNCEKIDKKYIKKDRVHQGEFHTWWKDTGNHLLSGDPTLYEIKKIYKDKRLLLIDFDIQDIDLITYMYFNKMYKRTLTRERYEHLRSLIFNGHTWAEFENWQDDPVAYRHLFDMHKNSYMPWINKIDRSLIDLTLSFKDIFNSPDLNRTLAGWCGVNTDNFIDEYIDRYRKINKNLYDIK